MLKKRLEDFSQTRRQFLVEPASAAYKFCATPQKDAACSLNVNIRVAGFWDDLCKHPEASTFYAERFYLLTLQCRSSLLKIYSQELPEVKSLIKR